MTHNIKYLYRRIHRQMPSLILFVHKQRMGLSHVVTNVLRKPILSGPLESDIGKVRDMSEIATEHMVYTLPIPYRYRGPIIFPSFFHIGLRPIKHN